MAWSPPVGRLVPLGSHYPGRSQRTLRTDGCRKVSEPEKGEGEEGKEQANHARIKPRSMPRVK
jgi:hypothetical protein